MDKTDPLLKSEFSGHKGRIVFDAIPKEFVGLSANKKSRKNLFYAIAGLHCEESQKYIVAVYIYKQRTKQKEIYFDLTSHETLTFANKMAVMDFIYKFLETFTPHERIINSNIDQLEPCGLDEVLSKLAAWMSKIGEYFILQGHLKFLKNR
jgi:hypothetical protein